MAPGCIDTIMGHVSVRRFLSEGVPRGDLERVVEAARRAPSSWNLQPVTVVIVTDEGLKKAISDIVGGQKHVVEAPVFLVFSVDYHKLFEASHRAGVAVSEPGIGHFVVAAIDVGISSAWAALAAEELGYGVVFVALYSNPCRVADLLGLPRHVVPLVGLALGKPAESPSPRPRHPREVFVAENQYPSPIDLGDKVRSIYRGGGAKLFCYVLGPDGYYDHVGKALLECLEQRGFRTRS